jgi:hypothetical protein
MCRRPIFIQRIVGSIVMIIRDIIADQTTQMVLIEDNYVVENLASSMLDNKKAAKDSKSDGGHRSGQSRRSKIQNNLSLARSRGRGCFRLSTPNCWRRATISRPRLQREREKDEK